MSVELHSVEYFACIGFCHAEDYPLRERQRAAQFDRQHQRCGGCGGFATRCEFDGDATGEEREATAVPLCDRCTLEDA